MIDTLLVITSDMPRTQAHAKDHEHLRYTVDDDNPHVLHFENTRTGAKWDEVLTLQPPTPVGVVTK